MESLSDRIKTYENVTRHYLTRRMPIVGRIDGKCFTLFTHDCKKPFDSRIMDTMEYAALETAKEIQGFKVGYVQSDEFSYVAIDYTSLTSSGWFDYNTSKIISVSSSIFTANFNYRWNKDYNDDFLQPKIAYFDSRVFNVPREEVCNSLLWRAQDWNRNSINMYARAFFSHKQLENKKISDMHEMLHGIGELPHH
jgi:tRNA(His) 5'-end guanylyltransferase